MTRSEASPQPKDASAPSLEQLQADIEKSRAELGETVEALTAKLDVKSRMKTQVGDMKTHATRQVTDVRTRANRLVARTRDGATTADGKPTVPVLGGAGAVLVVLVAVGVLTWRKR